MTTEVGSIQGGQFLSLKIFFFLQKVLKSFTALTVEGLRVKEPSFFVFFGFFSPLCSDCRWKLETVVYMYMFDKKCYGC